MKSNHFFSQIISFVLQPLLMPLYSLVILFVCTNLREIYPDFVWRFFFPVGILSYVAPVLSIYILVKLRVVRDFNLIDRRDRIFPYLITLISCMVLVYFFYYIGHVYFWMLGLIAVPVIILIFAFVVNLFYGISPHMLGIGGLLGGIISVCYNVKGINPFILFAVLFLLAGILGVARLQLRHDTPSQVYSGFIAGFVLAYSTVWLSSGYVMY